MKDNTQRIRQMTLAYVYPYYVAKAEKKGRTKAEVDEIICWLTGHTLGSLQKEFDSKTTIETFFNNAPHPHPNRHLITGTICGVKIKEITDDTVREVRYLDKLVDELANGRPMEKIVRKNI